LLFSNGEKREICLSQADRLCIIRPIIKLFPLSLKELLTSTSKDVVEIDRMPDINKVSRSYTYSNGLNGLSTLAGTLFLGWAALRAHMLPRPIAWILIVISIVTLPILLLTPLPVGPAWATDTLAFLLSGIGFAMVGVTLIVTWKQADSADARAASIGLAAEAK
jgi:hypothetical protein